MIAILKTVNPATLNFAQAVLKEADIPLFCDGCECLVLLRVLSALSRAA